MPVLSAEVTKQMQKWIDTQVRSGRYKSRSEVFRDLVRKQMDDEFPNKALVSQAVLEKVWKDEPDGLWESYLES